MTTITRSEDWIILVSATTLRADLDALFDALEAALADRGQGPADVVRNRLFAASRAGRDAASGVRFARLSGPARCATSSYIDAAAFAGGDGARIETLALTGAGRSKVTVEYDPREPPCRFVAAGDRVFLSGVTSTEPDIERQLAHAGRRVAESLELAADRLGRPVRPTAGEAWLHRGVDLDDGVELATRVGLPGLPFRIGRCDGYSKPGKLVEIEIDAVTGSPLREASRGDGPFRPGTTPRVPG